MQFSDAVPITMQNDLGKCSHLKPKFDLNFSFNKEINLRELHKTGVSKLRPRADHLFLIWPAV